MKKYKLILAGLIILLLVIFLGVFAWLWTNNLKNTNPLPIMSSESMLATDGEEDTDATANNVLHLQAPSVLQIPLDSVIVRFESRYPKVQILARYVPNNLLLTLPDSAVLSEQPSSFSVSTDMIFADDKLSQDQLATLQAVLNKSQNITKSSENEIRNLVSFSYALKGEQSVDAVILTDNPTAITFRNFLLSSTGQDILKQYNYDDIDGYKSSVDDIFNPASDSKAANDPVEVTDILANSE